MLDRIYRIITSLRLTVVLLSLGLVLVYLGTVAQEPLGLYAAQHRFFRSFFVDASSLYAAVHKSVDMLTQSMGHPLKPLEATKLLSAPRLPAFPGGYLIGVLLLINLFAAHFRYYQPGKRKIGIALIHIGVVLLLVGQLLTDILATESLLHLRHGETKNYTEASRQFELVVVDTTDPVTDKIVAIPTGRLARHREIQHAELPFTIRVQTFYPNSALVEKAAPGYSAVGTTAGFGAGFWWREVPHETEMDKRDMPSAIVELRPPTGSLGTFLTSAYLTRPQEFTHAGRTYQLGIRNERFYKPFTIHLLEFKHDKYPGTEIPKNFSSRVRLQRPATGEDREVLIYMNNPLRYDGETYYQASFDRDNQGTVLQVVRNPSWLTPYLACVLVSIGLLWQFFAHLSGFARKRKPA
ncbi:MAG: Cytochrome c biogenesis protein Ccs1 [Verrucomicrobiae bacterium]|nr:Cytochrome c biogenesis protein Ccs1 [Verrucomicrobiae bacterium]